MSDFVTGFYVKKPSERAPDFIIASIGINCKEFVEWARQNHKDGFVNIQIKESRASKFYAQVDDYVPREAPEESKPDDFHPDSDVPF